MTNKLQLNERQATFSLASIFSFRMFGLFLILPVLPIYVSNITSANTLTIGLALGAYGFSQGLLQLPFGALSDRFGRKKIITIGLILFAVGSVIAACSHSIWGIIIGRFIQGTGAIGSTIMAFVADVTREQVRAKAMAIIGASIGLSFTIAMIIAPWLADLVGISGLFFLMTCMAIFALLIVHKFLPDPGNVNKLRYTFKEQFQSIKQYKDLPKLFISIFCTHAILTALFLVLPLTLQQQLNLSHATQSILYFCVLVGSFIIFVPIMLAYEKFKSSRSALRLAFALVTLAIAGVFQLQQSFSSVFVWLLLFFTGFNLLEALLPACTTRIIPTQIRGATMGVFSSCQFLGMFAGGLVGGYLKLHFGNVAIMYFCLTICVFCLIMWFCSFRGETYGKRCEQSNFSR